MNKMIKLIKTKKENRNIDLKGRRVSLSSEKSEKERKLNSILINGFFYFHLLSVSSSISYNISLPK